MFTISFWAFNLMIQRQTSVNFLLLNRPTSPQSLSLHMLLSNWTFCILSQDHCAILILDVLCVIYHSWVYTLINSWSSSFVYLPSHCQIPSRCHWGFSQSFHPGASIQFWYYKLHQATGHGHLCLYLPIPLLLLLNHSPVTAPLTLCFQRAGLKTGK